MVKENIKLRGYQSEIVNKVIDLAPRCPNCRKKNYNHKNNGRKKYRNFQQKKYICKECGTEFRSPLYRQIKKIFNMTSLKCPKCTNKNNFSFFKDGALWKLTCESCGHVRFFTPFTATNNTEKKTESKDKKPSTKKDGNNGRLDSYMS